jgi:hypothetical protein
LNKIRGTYQRVEKEYTLSVDYTYKWDDGDYYTPPDDDLDITEAYIDSESISLDFYWDFLHDQLSEEIREHAIDNR